MTADLNKLTIFIMSRDRNQHLESTINYYKKYDIRLVIMHKARTPIDNKFFYSKLTYKSVDESYVTRCKISLEYLNTPYAILSTDDERYLPSTLVSMVKILRLNSSISSVGAQAIALSTYGPLVSGQLLYKYLHGYCNTKNTLDERTKQHFANAGSDITFSSMYRMYRRDDFCKMLELFSLNKGISTALITEVTSELFSLSLGDIVHVNELLWVRNFMVEPINTTDWQRSLTFIEWWQESRFDNERLKWLNALTGSLGNYKVILQGILMNRLHEKSGSGKIKYNYIGMKLKYLIRRILKPKSLPMKMVDACNELKELDIRYSEIELSYAINSMRRPFLS